MQKTKFQIKDMHCHSCASLIEEKLKKLKGIIEVKVNFDSRKAVIIYDENKVNEDEIKKAIKEVGDYKIEEGSEIVKENFSEQKTSPLNNFSVPISIIIAGLIIAGAIIVTNQNYKISLKENGQQAAQTLPDTNSPTQLSLEQPSQEPVAEFKITKDDHIRGDFNAPITLVEFSDFECSFCARHYLTLNKILSDYQGKVRLVYKHFPLGFHPNAQKAAEASECADEQGKFWEYHDKLFENLATSGYSLANFKQWAKDLGLNINKFNNCLDFGKYTSKVQTDYQEGLQKGVKGTPATFVNGQLVSGALPYESFKQIIDNLLNQ
jgi:protein-disulfide isomerase/copper chaperone CopZ